MQKRTTIVLAVINAALLVFILVYEQGTLSTSDTVQRRGQVLSAFVRDRVDRVEVAAGQEDALVLVREPSEDAEEGELQIGKWVIESPVQGAADDDAVDSLLGALEWLTARRTLEGVSDADRERFGLSSPRFTIRFSVMSERAEVRVGGEAPTGEGIYVGVVGEDRVHVVDGALLEELGHDVDHFRDKALFEGVYAANARRLSVRGLGETIVFARGDGPWSVNQPVTGLANAGLVDRLLRIVRQGRASRFVEEEDLARFGLDHPWRELRVGDADTPETFFTSDAPTDGEGRGRLRVGAVCGDHPDERYAMEGAAGPVFCLMRGDFEVLDFEPSDLREPRLLSMTDDVIDKIILTRGDTRIELRREGGTWNLFTGSASDPGEAQAADDSAIATWTAQLREARVLDFGPLDGAVGRSLESPRSTLTIDRGDRDEVFTLRVAQADTDGVWVRRGDEQASTRFGREAEALFDVDPLRFRSRRVVHADPASARAVAVVSGGVEQRAVREASGVWRLESPTQMEADRVRVSDVARRIAELQAVRFVASQAAREHGLSANADHVEVRFEPEDEAAETVVLELGASSPDGRFARIGGDGASDNAVFVVDPETADALLGALASLDALALVTEQLASIRVERGAVTHTLVHDGDAWRLDSGAGAEAAISALIDRLGTLRASRVERYGSDARAFALRVVATPREAGAEVVTLSFTSAADDALYARREGIDVTYAVRRDAAGPIVDFAP